MKQILLVLLMSIMSIGFAQDQKKVQKYQTVAFSCKMNCVTCKNKIEHNIAFEKGVRDIVADLESQTVTVKFRTKKNNKESIRKAIEELGFQPKEIQKEIPSNSDIKAKKKAE